MADLDDVVWPDTKNVLVIGRVVNLAQGQAIWYDGLAQWTSDAVGNNMRGVEEFAMMQIAHRTPTFVGQHHSTRKYGLVKSMLRLGQKVTTQGRFHRRIDVDS